MCLLREGFGDATTDLYGIDKFTYVPEQNCYLCPEGKLLK